VAGAGRGTDPAFLKMLRLPENGQLGSRQLPAGELLALVVMLALAVGPILLLIIWSFTHSWFWPRWWPESWSGRAWRYAVAPEAGVAGTLGVSFGIAVSVALLALLIAWPAARVMARQEFPGKRLLFFLFLLPVLAPPLASTMGMHALFLRYGLADTLTGVVLAHLVPSVPYAIMVLFGSFSRLEVGFEEQARTLGATRWQVWWRVTVPLLRPGLAVAGAFAFLISWSQYLSTLIIGGGRIQTLPLALISFQQSGDEAIAAVLALIFLAPALLVFLLVGRLMMVERGGE
jgi:putative spermidine/putrescine transport system permease protein